MNFTSSTVEKVAAIAEEFTGGAFLMQGVGSDIGKGVRYFDGITQQVWFDYEGARSACAYYIGAVLGWARETGTEIPEESMLFLRDVQTAYKVPALYSEWEIKGVCREWEHQGETTAIHRARERRS